MTIKLTEYLNGMERATTAAELEAAIRMPFKHAFLGKTWARISAVRNRKGVEICDAHPLGRFVPRFGPRRTLTVCDEIYRVGRGQNGAGVRYVWHGAGEWAKATLRQEGFSVRAAHRVWEGWGDYPHRCLKIVESALAGKIPDPELNVLIRHQRTGGGNPIQYSVEQNDADQYDRRATQPCDCGGTLFDWGAGHSEGFYFINWHCCACPEVFTEYMTQERLYELRAPVREARLAALGSRTMEAAP